MELVIVPQPVRVGTAALTVRITGSDGAPVAARDVRLEGNMSHPGMQPVFAAAQMLESGSYRASMEFTMGGDWFVTVTATLPDGSRLERQISVPGVRSR